MSRPLALLALLGLTGCATLAPRSRSPSPEAQVLEQVPLRTFEEDRCGAGSLSLVLNANGDPVSDAALDASLPRAPGGGVLSLDLLLAARRRGFDASLVAGDAGAIRSEIGNGRPVILMLKLLDLPGERRDVYHYVVADGFDPRRQLFRLQFGDGKARWAKLERVERAWRAAGHALLTVRRRWDETTDLRRGVELEASGRAADAAETYRRVLEAHPASARAWVNLANCEARLGRRESAEAAYRRALAISPEHRDALNNLAWLLLEEGSRLEEAETLATRAAAVEGPERALARDTLGRIQLARGRCADAATTFQQALAASEALAPEIGAGLLEGLRQARLACGRSEDRAR